MKNRKKLIISILIIIICAIAYGVHGVYESHLFNEDGTIHDGHAELINTLKNIENDEERKKQIDFFIENNVISKKEANELY